MPVFGTHVFSSGSATDPDFASVVLLLHCDGTDGSTTFTDVKGHTMTAVGNAQIDTAQYKFGGASGLFDGSGDKVTAADSVDFELGSGDFTIECWVRWNVAVSDATLISKWNTGGARSWSFDLGSSGTNLQFSYSTDGSSVPTISNAWSPAADTWYHVAVCRSGSNLYAFVNGTQIGTTQTISGTLYDGTALLAMGDRDSSSSQLNGWLDDIRITKGVARYTSNFTAPTAAFPDA